jgi:hypothetical protein
MWRSACESVIARELMTVAISPCVYTQQQKRDCHTPLPYLQTRGCKTSGVRNDKRCVYTGTGDRSL